MKFTALMPAALLLMTVFACNERKAGQAADVTLEKIVTNNSAATADEKHEQKPEEQKEDENVDWEKKIIKTASLHIECKNYQKYHEVLYEIVQRVGGYVAQEDQSQSEYKTETHVIIKVPVQQFNESITLLVKGTGSEKLLAKSIGSEDVTGEIVDIKSRLEAKKQVRVRYLDLLKQAKNMQEILQVQNEINDLQEQIEMADGRMSFLKHSSSYSTINLTFFELLQTSPATDNSPSFSLRLGQAFQNGWEVIKLIFLGLVSVWPLWLGVILIWIGWKKIFTRINANGNE